MGRLREMIGKKYGRWTVLRRDKKCASKVICRCSCGSRLKSVDAYSIRAALSKSCGCRRTRRSPHAMNLVGQTFGFMLVLRRHGSTPTGVSRWLCLCRRCDRRKVVTASNIVWGKTLSCGCYHKEQIARQKVSDIEYVAKRVCGNSRKHELGYSLTFDEVLWAIQQPCAYCGEAGQNHWMRRSGRSIAYTGLDRIDNELGYHADNVAPSCGDCNYFKADWPISRVIAWAKRVANLDVRRINIKAQMKARADRL